MPPVAWDWTVRYVDDTEPPPAPVASYVPTEALFANDFGADTGLWGNFLSCQALRRDTGGATGPGCLELRDLRDRTGAVFALVADFGEEWKRYHMLRFRYRSEDAPGSSFALQATTFDGSHEQWTSLASFAAKEEWQTAQVDLAQALAAADPRLIMHRLFLNVSIPAADGALLIDDYAMYSPTGSAARLRWAAPPDASGIAGYSWSLDQAGGTSLPEQITGTDTETEFTDLEPGSYWFHIRACDGAGNWGPPAHVPFDLRAE
jgi:hypothetical protein